MLIMKRNTLLPLALISLFALFSAGCTDEESALGINLVDSSLTYHGLTATLNADRALSVRDDSLLTTNYEYGVIGRYTDPSGNFGRVNAVLYTQIALPADDADINFNNMVIDSVVLSLRKTNLYYDTSHTYNFHFEVMQLAEALLKDTAYYDYDTLPVNPAARYFDDDITVGKDDTVVRMKLDNSIASILTHKASADEFLQITKGLRIRTTDAGEEGMMGIDLTHTDTRLEVHYRSNATDVIGSTYIFLLGGNACRFQHFEHDYTGATASGADSLDGSNRLYLEPLAGYNIYVSFDQAIRTFLQDHPYATIHQAEMLLPVAPEADGIRPERVLALSVADSNSKYIADLIDPYTMVGYDGKYNESRNCYRLRVTQHVQSMLRKGFDTGTLLVLNSRRNAPARTVVKGTSDSDPIRIEIIYSE